MFDVSQVTMFAGRLAADLTFEDDWKDEWADRVADEMRHLVPVDTGRLRASIQATGGNVEVGEDYGQYVEYGTSTQSPRPFVTPAVDRMIGPAADDARRRVIRLLT